MLKFFIKYKKSTILFVIYIVFLLLSWIFEYILNNTFFSFYDFLNIHYSHPTLIFAEIIPSFIIVMFFLKEKVNFTEKIKLQNEINEIFAEKIKLQKEVDEHKEIIKKNAEIAQKIGDGNYAFYIPMDNPDDILAKTFATMRRNLFVKHEKDKAQMWITRGKEIISDILRSHNNIDELSSEILVQILNYTESIEGAIYLYDEESGLLINKAAHSFKKPAGKKKAFHKIGEGLVGRAASEMTTIYKKDLSRESVVISSGIIRDKNPSSLMITPLQFDNKLYGILEINSVENNIPEKVILLVEKLGKMIARTFSHLTANLKTEKLLKEAQAMTQELRENEDELKQNAEEMRLTQEKIEEANQNLEMQIQLVETSKQKLNSLIENASEVISIYHPDGTIVYESPSIRNILGYGADEIIGTDGFARVINSSHDFFVLIFARLLKNPETQQKFEFQYVKKDGTFIWMESIGRNLLNNPAINGIIFNSRNISERILAEKEQRKRGQMQSLSENSPDMIIRLATDGTFYYVNPVVEKYTFIPPSKFFQKNINDLSLEPEMKILLNSAIQEGKLRNKKSKLEFEIESLFEKKQMLVNIIPEINDDKELESVLVVIHDNTELKKIETEIREKNINITESINYARRIQTSIIPSINLIREHLKESFVFYKPKDIISGDFPWFFKKGDCIYIAAVDCTGHGVPGALLSFIGYFLLNNIVDHSHEYDAGDILFLLHEGVKLTLKQNTEKHKADDGMDIALCKIKLNENKLQFAGAHRPLYLLRNKELIEYKAEKKAIGGTRINRLCGEKFATNNVDLLPNDKVFFFTDGLSDQYSENEKKYSTSKIKCDIVQHADFSMQMYFDYFTTEFKKWKGDTAQTDDVLMIGIEF